MLRSVTAIRYVTPLREGGSLPGLMEADDLGTYAVKFTGAGQGRTALVAEVISGELARALGLPMPELVVVDVDPALAAGEPDEEVQDLLRRSPGPNLGVDFLPGALDLDTGAFALDPVFAGEVLWFDALVGNVDRSWRNPNLLFWHERPYLIDHGATLTFHHNWAGSYDPTRPYDADQHALIGAAPDLDAAEERLAARVSTAALRAAVAAVPDAWLDGAGFATRAEHEAAYVQRLAARLAARDSWLPALRATVARHVAHGRPPTPRHRPSWLGPGRPA